MFELSVFDEDVLLGRSDHDRRDLSIGSSAAANVRLDDGSVGPTHARITRRDDGYFIEPLGPVAVNGRAVTDPSRLSSGDKIGIGRFTLVVANMSDLSGAATDPELPAATLDAPVVPVTPASEPDPEADTNPVAVARPHTPANPIPTLASESALAEAPTAIAVPDPAAPADMTIVDAPKKKVEPSPAPAPAPVRPAAVSSQTPAPATKKIRGEVHRLMDLLGRAEAQGVGSLGLRFPVLVSKASLSLREAEGALVYELGAMRGAVLSDEARLSEEQWRLYVGRARESHIVISDISVSKRHAALVRRDKTWTVVDLDSVNGTFVDGEKVERAPFDVTGALATVRFGPKARYAFMNEVAFGDYIRELLAERNRQKFETTRTNRPAQAVPTGTPVPGRDRERTQLNIKRGLSHEIIRRVEGAPFIAQRYKVVCDEARVEEFDVWADLVSFVEESANEIVEIEVSPEHGKGMVVYRRAGGAKR